MVTWKKDFYLGLSIDNLSLLSILNSKSESHIWDLNTSWKSFPMFVMDLEVFAISIPFQDKKENIDTDQL